MSCQLAQNPNSTQPPPEESEQKAQSCAIAWSIRGEVKDIFLPRPGGEGISLPSSPVRKGRGWVLPRILYGSISVASLLSSEDVEGFLKRESRGGCLVGNT